MCYYRVRAYEFQYGLLFLRAKEAESLSNKEVAANYGQGKGPLLDSWDDVMPVTQFNRLGEFTEA